MALAAPESVTSYASVAPLVRQPTCRNEILEQRVQRQTRLNYAESRQNPTKRKYLIFAQQQY